MKFDNIPPKWDAQGTEPSADLQANGFTAGYKPPAAYFNYLFNKITACLKELQTKLISTADKADTTAANSIKAVGDAIPDNANLNTYITDGVYYSAGATVSATLGNAPYSTCGFRLMVVPTITGNGFKKQIVLPSGRNSMAVRSYYNNEWEDWFYVESVGKVDELLTTDKSSVVAAVNELVNNTCSLAGGTKLTNGANLNEFKTVGNYYCHQNNIAATLINSPTNSAFTLKVGFAAGSIYPSQEITLYNTGVRYYRWFNTETSAWSEYRVFAPTGDLAALTTTKKDNVVAAINEINSLVKWLDANSLKSLGTDLPENADLDTYTTNGVYRSPNAARSKTLNSAPYTGCGFRFIVCPTIGGSTYIKQIAIPSATDQFAMRTLLMDGWTDWAFISDCGVQEITLTEEAAQIFTSKLRKQGDIMILDIRGQIKASTLKNGDDLYSFPYEYAPSNAKYGFVYFSGSGATTGVYPVEVSGDSVTYRGTDDIPYGNYVFGSVTWCK